jgi:hypothetical protein
LMRRCSATLRKSSAAHHCAVLRSLPEEIFHGPTQTFRNAALQRLLNQLFHDTAWSRLTNRIFLHAAWQVGPTWCIMNALDIILLNIFVEGARAIQLWNVVPLQNSSRLRQGFGARIGYSSVVRRAFGLRVIFTSHAKCALDALTPRQTTACAPNIRAIVIILSGFPSGPSLTLQRRIILIFR